MTENWGTSGIFGKSGKKRKIDQKSETSVNTEKTETRKIGNIGKNGKSTKMTSGTLMPARLLSPRGASGHPVGGRVASSYHVDDIHLLNVCY